MSTFNSRTYGKKSLAKRKQSMNSAPPQKRRRISEEREPSTDVERHHRETTPPPLQRTYGTPKRQALSKGLSEIFDSVTPVPSPTSSPSTKLAKRMLARSKTDSSIDNTSSVRIERTPSTPNLPSPIPKPSHSLSADLSPLPIPVPIGTRTYAGKSRSFLVAIPSSTLDSIPLGGEEEDEYSTRESYASLRSRWGVDNSEDDPYAQPIVSSSRSNTTTPNVTPSKNGKGKSRAQKQTLFRAMPLANSMMNPLKSITELRNKGESRRFLDEVGYLFEGMEATAGIGLKRASALEIVTKLCDVDFSRKAKAADFLPRAWDVFIQAGAGKGEDKILDTLLAFFTSLVSRDPVSLAELAQHSTRSTDDNQAGSKPNSSSLVDTLFSLLNSPVDALALVFATSSGDGTANDTGLKKMGIGKKERSLFLVIHDTLVSKSSLFPPNTPISTHLLLIRALQTLPPALIPKKHLPALLTSLHTSLLPISTNTPPPSAYLAWLDATKNIPFESVYHHLRLLDVYLLGQWDAGVTNTNSEEDEQKERKSVKVQNKLAMDKAREEWLVDALFALGVCAELHSGPSARACTETMLRVLVSLTHGDALWAQKVLECDCALDYVIRLILSSSGYKRGVDLLVKDEEDNKGRGKGKEGVKQELDDEDRYLSTDEEAPTHDGDGARDLDGLYLALGLLTNLVQMMDSTKDILREIRLDPSCTLRKRGCIRRCTCSKGNSSISALDVLVQLYNRQLVPTASNANREIPIKSEATSLQHSVDTDADTADALFLRGHLAVLFGLLMRGNSTNQEFLLVTLGSTVGSVPATLELLVEQANEFVTFYDTLSGGAESDRDGRVARDVVTFLEELRDGRLVG